MGKSATRTASFGRWLVVIFCACLSVCSAPGWALASTSVVVEVFVREDCPRCAAAEVLIEELRAKHPPTEFRIRQSDRDPVALADLRRATSRAGVTTPGVPTFVVGDRILVGFESTEITGAQLEALIEGRPLPSGTQTPASTCSAEDATPCEPSATDSAATRFGVLSVSKLGMPLFTIAMGLIDGFNPCATWVLLFLLSMLLSLRSRERLALIAGTFVLASGVVYFAFMAAWFNAFALIGFSKPVRLVLGALALGVGVLNLKDFVAFQKGLSVSIPDAAKPHIYRRVRSVLRAQSTLAALVGAAVLAVMVNMVELLCTAGLPALYTAILAQRALPWWGYYGYLGLYNVAYVADDALMVAVALVTLRSRKLTVKGGRMLKAMSGVVMVTLAIMLLFFPKALA